MQKVMLILAFMFMLKTCLFECNFLRHLIICKVIGRIAGYRSIAQRTRYFLLLHSLGREPKKLKHLEYNNHMHSEIL